MLRDITIGQHFAGNSAVHNMDPRFKIVLTIIFVVMLFVVPNFGALTISLFFLVLLYAASKIPIKVIIKSLKPIVPIILFTSVLNLFFMQDNETPIFSFWVIEVHKTGIEYAILIAVRIILLIAGTSLLTYTTSPIALTDAIERLLKPFAKLRLPVHELAMIMTIALRFIPLLIEETEKIMNAQKARGAQLDFGSLKQRIQALVPVLIPLFISAFRRADELAMAMECRCYNGGEGRTRMRRLHITLKDILLCAFCLIIFTLMGLTGLWFDRIGY